MNHYLDNKYQELSGTFLSEVSSILKMRNKTSDQIEIDESLEFHIPFSTFGLERVTLVDWLFSLNDFLKNDLLERFQSQWNIKPKQETYLSLSDNFDFKSFESLSVNIVLTSIFCKK